MNNPDKTIKGLRNCLAYNKNNCRGCPYYMNDGGYRTCTSNLMLDALETVEFLYRAIKEKDEMETK